MKSTNMLNIINDLEKIYYKWKSMIQTSQKNETT